MTAGPRGRCSSCGAAVPRGAATCPYCAAELAATASAPPADPAALLAAVRAHPSYARLAAEAPPVPFVLRAMFLAPVAVGGCFLLVSLVFAGVIVAAAFGTGVRPFVVVAIVPLILLPAGIAVIVGAVKARRRMLGSAPTAAPAVVLEKRPEPSRNGTSYYVTLLFEDGDRREFGALQDVFGSVFPNDAGVAHCRGKLLLGFRKVGA